MLDFYTQYQGGSANCRLCRGSIEHIISVYSFYYEVRIKKLGEMKSVCERSNSGIILDEFVENSYLLTLLILDCCSLNQVLKSPSVCHSFFHSFILSFIPLKFSSTVLYNSVRHTSAYRNTSLPKRFNIKDQKIFISEANQA